MALFVTRETKRYTHPDDPETWVEMRLPPGAGQLRTLNPAEGETAAVLALLSQVITAWSDDRAVTPAAIDDLDPQVLAWLGPILRGTMRVRGDEEKKASNGVSSQRSNTGRRSPKNSGT